LEKGGQEGFECILQIRDIVGKKANLPCPLFKKEGDQNRKA
jgi:hypothetical protein